MKYLLTIIFILSLLSCSKDEPIRICETSDFLGSWEAVDNNCRLNSSSLIITEYENSNKLKVNSKTYKRQNCDAVGPFESIILMSSSSSIEYLENDKLLMTTKTYMFSVPVDTCETKYYCTSR